MRVVSGIVIVCALGITTGLWLWLQKGEPPDRAEQPSASGDRPQSPDTPIPPQPQTPRPTGIESTALSVEELEALESQRADDEWATHTFPGPETFEAEPDPTEDFDPCTTYGESLEKIAALRAQVERTPDDPTLLRIAADLYLLERKHEVLALQIDLLESFIETPLTENEDSGALADSVSTHRARLSALMLQTVDLRREAATFPGSPLQHPGDAYTLLMGVMWRDLALAAAGLLDTCKTTPDQATGVREVVEQAMGLADDEAHGHSVGSLTFARKHARVSL